MPFLFIYYDCDIKRKNIQKDFKMDEQLFKFGLGEIVLIDTSFGFYKTKVIHRCRSLHSGDAIYTLESIENNEPVIEEGEIIHAPEAILHKYEGR